MRFWTDHRIHVLSLVVLSAAPITSIPSPVHVLGGFQALVSGFHKGQIEGYDSEKVVDGRLTETSQSKNGIHEEEISSTLAM